MLLFGIANFPTSGHLAPKFADKQVSTPRNPVSNGWPNSEPGPIPHTFCGGEAVTTNNCFPQLYKSPWIPVFWKYSLWVQIIQTPTISDYKRWLFEINPLTPSSIHTYTHTHIHSNGWSYLPRYSRPLPIAGPRAMQNFCPLLCPSHEPKRVWHEDVMCGPRLESSKHSDFVRRSYDPNSQGPDG